MMGRTLRAGALALCILAATACSHKDQNAPLAFVPANTPFLIANLKPLDNDTQNALLKKLNDQLPLQIQKWNQAADTLRNDGKTDEANLLQALATEFKGKTYQQISATEGFDLHGLSAMYGIGLSPVIRAQLSDTAKFHAFIKRLETAYGRTFQVSKFDGVSYQHTTLGSAGVQAVIATEHKQAVIALVPADAGKTLLGEVLGTRRPKKSAQDSGRLKKLADQRDYLPYAIGYLDTTKLPALLTSGTDPMLAALLQKSGKPAFPASCKADLARMAARVPQLSFGYSALDAKHMSTKFEADLAPDITKALSGVKVALPGMGGDLDAPLDLAIGLPLPKLRAFWDAQAAAVAKKPFSCPRLQSMNAGFVKLRQSLQKTAIPPFGDLRGLRISLQQLGKNAANGKPQATGAIVIGSSNPQGLIAIAQTVMPSLAKAHLTTDGKPVALSGKFVAMTGGPAWIAMNKHAIAIGVGAGENKRLDDLLNAPEGNAGTMFKWHVSGPMYAQLVDLFSKEMGGYMQARALRATAGADDKEARQAAASAKQFKQSMAEMHRQAEDIKSMDANARIDRRGLVISTTIRMK